MSSPRAASLTAEGTNDGHFEARDWALLVGTALIWGSSFLWIAIGLEALHPGAIALIRTALGAAVVWMVKPARRRVDRSAWPAISAVAIFGNAGPAILFPLAQQRVESSVAGMLNSTSPILVLVISFGLTRKAPPVVQLAGLGIGLTGALLMASPNVVGSDAQPIGVALVVAAIFGYALSNNLTVPLQQAWGGPAVVARALGLSTVILAPYGAYGLAKSSFAWGPVLAILILGIFGTGLARSLFATLTGRVGAPRSSMIGYFVPLVAIALGVIVRDEKVTWVELVGTALVLLGAWLISRGRARLSGRTA